MSALTDSIFKSAGGIAEFFVRATNSSILLSLSRSNT